MTRSPHDADDWNARYRATDSVWSLEPNVFVAADLADTSPGAMIDLGGGEGRHALWFASRGWTVENIDFASVALDTFRERAERAGVLDRCVATVGSALTPGVATTAPVDLVVIGYLQLGRDELRDTIANAASMLHPGGTLYGVWHERGNVGLGLGGPQNPDVNPTVDELLEHASLAGLTVDTCERRWREITRDDVTGRAVDVVLRAHKTR